MTHSDQSQLVTTETTTRESRLPRFSLNRRITVFMLLLTLVVLGTVATVSIPLELCPSGFEGPHLSVLVPWRDAPAKEKKSGDKAEKKAPRRGRAYRVLVRPLITEKAANLGGQNKYVFADRLQYTMYICHNAHGYHDKAHPVPVLQWLKSLKEKTRARAPGQLI